MNVLPIPHPIDPATWERPAMRDALARRDIGEVFRLLGTSGVSQRRIAALTGQNQSEVSEIVKGRQVQSYDVLARVAEGFGIPRGHLGLAHTDDTAFRPVGRQTPLGGKEDDPMERRAFLGLVSKVVVGAGLTPAEHDMLSISPIDTPTPRRVGTTDVTRLRALTGSLRAYDAAHGGGSCRDAILAHTRWAESLLDATHADHVRPELLSAVAEVKTLAGWAAHDLGRPTEARRYLLQAVQDTQAADNTGHAAIVLYHLGRVPLDNGDPGDALKVFQLAQIPAKASRSAATVALLLANEALAYASLGDPGQAMTALRRAEDEYAHATDHEQPEYLEFFDQGALQTHIARTHTILGLTDPTHRVAAIDHLHDALAQAPADRCRQRAFNLSCLATCTLAEGDLPAGAAIGREALDAIAGLHSPRLLASLLPLHAQARRHPHHSDLRQLAHDIHRLRTAV
ncbi:helix-turn-helix transcriptional regulator [Actinokineospora auranticolor]|uniref:HTH cro/C1-type domain-containing protein n=1 Tax=Actinokineospora auranticolor TaxID=155976 RepID=A0A2S6H0X3_9PSEU|nr:helix-turn-helix transcriptional regulator [Actinokineospora auranticolor]PPK71057.1 hypothetical protein CLV40_101243 [Actinokineospora auranticolor]